jgi:hypothetical protein
VEKWKEKKPSNMKTINSNVKNDVSPDSNQKFKEVIQAMEFIYVKQLKAMNTRLAEAESCIKYLDPIEPELHSEQEREFYLEIPEEPIDESLTGHEETKDFEFEMIEYPNNSNPHPPPEEPISSKKIFDNYDKLETISEVEVLTVPVPISHLSEELIIDNGKVEDNSSLSMPDHYEQWLGFHHDSPMQIFIKTLQGFPDFNVWLNKMNMFLGWSDPKKRAKLIKLGKGSSKNPKK